MASLPFGNGLKKRQPCADSCAGSLAPHPDSRWTRYADMAAIAGVGIGFLVAIFGMLEYQRKTYGDAIAPLAVAISEMDKRLTGEIRALDSRLSGEIKGLGSRIDETNRRLSNLETEVGGVNVRLGRLEGKFGK